MRLLAEQEEERAKEEAINFFLLGSTLQEKQKEKVEIGVIFQVFGFSRKSSMRNSLFEFLFLLCLMDPPLLDYR